MEHNVMFKKVVVALCYGDDAISIGLEKLIAELSDDRGKIGAKTKKSATGSIELNTKNPLSEISIGVYTERFISMKKMRLIRVCRPRGFVQLYRALHSHCTSLPIMLEASDYDDFFRQLVLNPFPRGYVKQGSRNGGTYKARSTQLRRNIKRSIKNLTPRYEIINDSDVSRDVFEDIITFLESIRLMSMPPNKACPVVVDTIRVGSPTGFKESQLMTLCAMMDERKINSSQFIRYLPNDKQFIPLEDKSDDEKEECNPNGYLVLKEQLDDS